MVSVVGCITAFEISAKSYTEFTQETSLEAFYTDDGSVAKFIHDDGSETAIKVVKSCSNFRDESGRVHTEWVDRHKYSVFISASLGCYMQCPFCHLTIKDSSYRKLYTAQVVANVKEAIEAEIQRRPEMRDRYVKLCWMGMGDAISQPDMVHDATLELMEWLMDNGYTQGLDCVDLSTVLPKVKDGWLERFVALNDALLKYPVNPNSFLVEQAEVSTHQTYQGRSRFRMFWSVHSALQATRDKMVPNAMPLADALPKLVEFSRSGPNLLLHQLFVEGLNDSSAEVDALLKLLAAHFPEQELRVLRYNFCDRSPYREWDNIDQAVSRIADQHASLKVQVSAGKEVAAACGQFLVAHPRSLKKRIAVIPVPSEEHVPVALAKPTS
jgi:adenine C2-methylase RlmN of 23S rRNA A2503 and tRNA A37